MVDLMVVEQGKAKGGSVREYLVVIRKRWYVLLLAVLIGGGAGAAVSYTSTPLYQSAAGVYFAVQTGGTAADLSQSGNFAQSQMPTFASFATLPIVLDPVIKQLRLQRSAADLAGSVSAAASSTTVIINITVSDPNPQQAARISNAIATQLGTVVTDLSVRNTAGQPSVVSKTVSPALPASAPFSPRTRRNIAAGLLAGLLLGYLLAYAWERLDNRVRTVEDATDTTKAPLLGQIWTDRALNKGHQVMVDGPYGPLAEAIRSIRTNVQFLRLEGKPLVAIVTSALSGEGKTTTSINLAIALAETEAKVLLIDADLRRPAVAANLDLEGAVGLTTVLIGQANLAEVIQPWGNTGLDILPSGQVPPNPSELLGSAAMIDLLEALSSRYDYVLLDSAPLLPVTDTAVLAMSGFGTVLVTAAGEVTRSQLRDAVAAIGHVGGEVLGVVVNKLPHRSAKRAAYSYGTPGDVQMSDAPMRPIRRSTPPSPGATPSPGASVSPGAIGTAGNVDLPPSPSAAQPSADQSSGGQPAAGRNGAAEAAATAEATRLVRAARHLQADDPQD